MQNLTEWEQDRASRDQYQSWLMRHGKHWNDIRSQTEDACVEVDHAAALRANLDRACHLLKVALQTAPFADTIAQLRADVNRAEQAVLKAGL